MSPNQVPYNFALIGAAGYIAPRHMKAIKETGNNLVALLDKYDGLGVVDSYFPAADVFLEPERFDRHLDKLRRKGVNKIDYVSICSPNYLHDSHIRLSLRNDAHAICEKPLVLNPWNVDALGVLQEETGKHIFNILQLRHHDSILTLKEMVDANPGKTYDIDLTYITSRGKWYHWSWKGDPAKSGGVATNIGIHFFDMLVWIFGRPTKSLVHCNDATSSGGFLELEKARVRWFLSIDEKMLPEKAIHEQKRTFRSIKVDDQEIEFSDGFTDLHTLSYREILKGEGYGLEAARPSIELAYQIRTSQILGAVGDFHPFVAGLNQAR